MEMLGSSSHSSQPQRGQQQQQGQEQQRQSGRGRKLKLQDRQAYQGAKNFYIYFLPTSILIASILSIYECQSLNSQILESLLGVSTIGMYLLSKKYYTKCNEIPTELDLNKYHHIKQPNNNTTSTTTNGKNYLNDQSMPEIQEQQEESHGHDGHDDDDDREKNQGIRLMQSEDRSLEYKEEEIQNTEHDIKPKKVNDDGQGLDFNNDFPRRYHCGHCQILVPYRSRHCFRCQICIERYDHHCFWIGNCVGSHNHKQFYIFLLLQTITNILTTFILSNLSPLLDHSTLLPFLIYLALLLMSIGFIIFTGYLFIYHTMLMMTGMTTWQHMRRSKITYLNYLPSGYNPFSQSKGVIGNIRDFWGRKYINKDYSSQIVPFSDAENIEPPCNIIENRYYNCC